MNISFEIPQDIEQLRTDGVDPSRQAKEVYFMEQQQFPATWICLVLFDPF